MKANIRKLQVRPTIMGIVNLTPDSFSDGGDFNSAERAIAHAEELLANGAEVIDFGAESTRPGAEEVGADEEWQRLEPVLSYFERRGLSRRVSLDSRSEQVVTRALEYFDLGWINNVSGLFAENVMRQIAQRNINYVTMHMHGSPQTMQRDPLEAAAAVAAVEEQFTSHRRLLTAWGMTPSAMYFDPGIGFGKTDAANLSLLQHISDWSDSSFQVLVGLSRKSFIGRLLGIADPKLRDAPSKVWELMAILDGAKVIRTHDVKTLVRLLNTSQDGWAH